MEVSIGINSFIYDNIIVLGEDNREFLREEQIGFSTGWSRYDAIFILKQIIEKHQEVDKQTHIAFIDFVKATDNMKSKLMEY